MGAHPEPRSKFERALALLDAGRDAQPLSLLREERARLEAYAAGADAHLAARARAILGRADGLPPRELVSRSGLSAGRVRFWVRAFRGQRLGIFDGSANQRISESANQRISESANQRINESANQRISESANQRISESANRRDTGSADRPPRASGRRGSRGGAKPTSQPANPPAAPLPRASASGGLPTLAEFCRQQGVDPRHARHVAKQAVALFNALRPVHRLPRKRRKLLEQAALLCNIGAAADPEHAHAAGRDLILAQPLRNVSTADRLALACIVAFQRDKVKPEREITLTALEEKLQGQVLALSALLHVAEALDFSCSQTTRVQAVEGADSKQCEVLVTGPQAEVDALQAVGRSALWYQLFKQELVFLVAEPEDAGGSARLAQRAGAAPASGDGAARLPAGEPAAPVPAEPSAPAAAAPALPEIPPVRSDEAMSEAGREVLHTHFTRMLANEAGTRQGEDIEALHDMRVSTRRMRAAYQVFQPYFDKEAIAPFNKALRRTGRTLGAVRDLDVLLEKAEAYQAGLAEGGGGALEPLLADWRTRREVARRQMLEYLDSSSYRRFVADFGSFLTTAGAGALPRDPGESTPYQVRHVVPRLVFTAYEAVRAYETILDAAPITTYHRLRIDFKRLRYGLEFFRSVLGPGNA